MKTKLLAHSTLGTFLMCLLVASCAPKETTVKTYTKDGVKFSYVSDWSVIKDAPVDGAPDIRSIQIEGPHDAIVCLICLSGASQQTIEEYAEAVANRRTKSINKKFSFGALQVGDASKGTSEPTSGKISGHEQKGIHQHFSANIFGVEVPHDAMFFEIDGTKFKILITAQVAEENLKTSRRAIELILDSLRMDGQFTPDKPAS
jgi:hypothetical protein